MRSGKLVRSYRAALGLAERCGPHRALVLLLGCTGPRWGEAAALRVRTSPVRRLS